MKRKEIFISGYAKLPQGITATELYNVIAVGMIVDYDTGTICDVDCTLSTDVAKKFIKQLLIDQNINDLPGIEAAFNEYYFGSAKKALISAIHIVNERYVTLKSKTTELD